MALLNSLATSMQLLNSLAGYVELQKPNGFPWQLLLVSVYDFVTNYGWRVVLFALCLKLLLSPLEFMSRYKMRKNAKINESIKDKLEAVEKRFSDPMERYRATAAIRKQAGASNLMACLPMLITPIIFLWMSFSLSGIATYQHMQQYVKWYNVYREAYEMTYQDIDSDDYSQEQHLEARRMGQEAVYKYYNEDKNAHGGFLWIHSMWSPDVPWAKPVQTKQDFEKSVGDYHNKDSKRFIEVNENTGERKEFNDLERTKLFDQYTDVTDKIYQEYKDEPNGYMILVFLSAGVSFLSFWFMMKQQKKSGNNPMGGMMMNNPLMANSATTMKIMGFIMPVMYVIFSIIQSSLFSVYMIASSAISMSIMFGINGLIKLLEKSKDHKEIVTIKKYGRPDPNDLLSLKDDKKDE